MEQWSYYRGFWGLSKLQLCSQDSRVTNLPYHGFTRGHGYNRLHVESFWGSLLLSVKNILLRLLKVFLGHLEKRGVQVKRENEQRISTFILLSLRARRPASVQIALMSAPERSSYDGHLSWSWHCMINFYLWHDVLFKVHVFSQGHFPWQSYCISWTWWQRFM